MPSLLTKNGSLIQNDGGIFLAVPTSKIPFYSYNKLTRTITSDGYYNNTPAWTELFGPADIVIPVPEAGPVEHIADSAFYMTYGNYEIKSVTFPEGLLTIGTNAFNGNHALTLTPLQDVPFLPSQYLTA